MGDSTRGRGPAVDERKRSSVESSKARSQKSAFRFDERDEDESIAGLLRHLVDQGTQLAEQQSSLIQAELRAGLSDVTTAVGAIAGAGVVAIAGLGVLLMGISFLVAKLMPLWLATLIVAVATMAVAYAMYAGGKKKIQSSSLRMDRTRRTIERTPSAIAGNDSEVHHGR